MYSEGNGATATDPVADYERRRADLTRERARVLDQHRKGYIDDDELDEAMLDLRKRESRLSPPMARRDQLSQGLQAIQTIMSLGAQWRAADGRANQRLRHVLAYSLLQPDGLLFDPVEQRIAGLMPDPNTHLAIKTMLEPHGWTEEDGVLWSRDSGVPTPQRPNRYFQIMQVLRRGPATGADIQRFLGMKRQNVAEVVARMIEQRMVSRRSIPKRNQYEYTWIGGDTLPQDALRLWEDRKGRYTSGATPSMLSRPKLLPVR
jgi:hypothetical protein